MRPVSRAEALAADEMWLSSSTKEVLAVHDVDGTPFAGGTPGPVFRKMHALFQAKKRALSADAPASLARRYAPRAGSGLRRPVAAVMEHEAAAVRARAGLDFADEQHVVAGDGAARGGGTRTIATQPSISGAPAAPSR